MTTGVAYFDDPVSLSGGWCSIDGGKAVRFGSPAELEPHLIWMTNINMTDFRNSQLNNTAHIRNKHFFGMSLSDIALELDIKPSDPIPGAVEMLSQVASRIVDITKLAFPGMGMGASLSDSIYDHLNFRDQQSDPARQYQAQFQSAFQENSIVTGVAWPSTWDHVRLIPNRIAYAELLLSYPVPIGAWREIHGDGMTIEDFIGMDHPAIAQVEVNISGADNPELLAFGVQRSTTAITREWVSQPEAHFMLTAGVRFTKIHRVLCSSASDVMPVLPREITSGAFVRSSYSAGVLAENIIYALMSKRYMRNSSKTAKTRYFFSTRAVYMRSVDRMLSFAVARKLHEQGFKVVEYGFGSVKIRATEDEMPQIMSVGADLGFMLLATSKLGKDGVI